LTVDRQCGDRKSLRTDRFNGSVFSAPHNGTAVGRLWTSLSGWSHSVICSRRRRSSWGPLQGLREGFVVDRIRLMFWHRSSSARVWQQGPHRRYVTTLFVPGWIAALSQCEDVTDWTQSNHSGRTNGDFTVGNCRRRPGSRSC